MRVVTWLGEPRGARVDRRYLVFRESSSVAVAVIAGRPMTQSGMSGRDALVAEATTEWVFANSQGQPRRIPVEIVRLFRAGIAHGSEVNPQGA